MRFLLPVKAAGLCRAGSKGLGGGNKVLYHSVKPSRGLVQFSQKETWFYTWKNVWRNWDANIKIKAARHPLWNPSRLFQIQRCPRRVPGGVWPLKSDMLFSSAFLLIRTSGAPPPLLSYSPSHSALRSSSRLFFSPFLLQVSYPFTFCFLSSLYDIVTPPIPLVSAYNLSPYLSNHCRLWTAGRQQAGLGACVFWVLPGGPYLSLISFQLLFICTITE